MVKEINSSDQSRIQGRYIGCGSESV